MRNVFTSFMFFLLHGFCSAQQEQSAYYDAMFIYQNCFDNTDETFKKREDLYAVLLKYYSDPISEATLRTNPFLKTYVPAAIPAAAGVTSFKNLITSAGNANGAGALNALVEVIIKLSKKELNIAFFRKFREYLEPYPELKIIFPSTVNIISSFEAHSYASMLQALRSSFFLDLNNLTSSLVRLRETSNYIGYTTPEIKKS